MLRVNVQKRTLEAVCIYLGEQPHLALESVPVAFAVKAQVPGHRL
jgi:hypothetical protein